MTVCIVIPANPGSGSREASSSTLPITRYWLLSFHFGRWTLDCFYLTHHDSEECVPIVRATSGLEDTVPASSDG